MSRVLSELLGAKEPAFAFMVQDLELLSGSTGVDIHLQIELTAKTRAKLRELGLDPRDTTAKEFYHGLQAITALHDDFLLRFVGCTNKTAAKELIPQLVALAERLHPNRQCWGLKHSVAKRLVKAQPPKQVMKYLGYKSVDSMLKRESIAAVVIAARCIETSQWQERFLMSLAHVMPSDFEKRPIELLTPRSAKWEKITEQFLARKHSCVVHTKELGAIAVLPLPRSSVNGLSLTVLPLIIHYLNEIRLYSAYLKLSQVRPDFTERLIKTLLFDQPTAVRLGGQQLHWRVIQRHFGRPNSHFHPEVFEPHVQPEDLRWHKAEELLYKTEPALKFWDGLDYVAMPTKTGPLSLNLLDNAICYFNGLEYEQRVYSHFRANLWNELLSRYLRSESLEQQVIDELGNDLLTAEAGLSFAGELI